VSLNSRFALSQPDVVMAGLSDDTGLVKRSAYIALGRLGAHPGEQPDLK
jgi:hypothetical protein